MKKSKFIIIDGNALIHRSFHAIPPLQNKKGQLTNAVYGFVSILLKVLKELKPEYVAVTFDKAKKTFRHEEYKEYKAKRVKQPQELYDQIPLTKQILEVLNIPYYEKDGYEADDLIGTIVTKNVSHAKDLESYIVTGDLDTLQLVNEHTKVYTPKRGMGDTIIYDEEQVKERYGLTPDQMIDFKSLRGDPSDNIPGVKGIGEKGAINLLKSFKTLEGVYKHIDSEKIKDSVRQKLTEQKKEAYLSKKLATIILDVPFKFSLEENKLEEADEGKVIKVFQEFGFKTLLSRLPGISQPEQGSLFGGPESKKQESVSVKRTDKYYLINTEEKFKDFLEKLKRQKEFALDTETDGLDPRQSKLLGISFSWKEGEAYYLALDSPARAGELPDDVDKAGGLPGSSGSTGALAPVDWLEKLKSIFVNPQIKKIGHNIKFDLAFLRHAGLELKGVSFDTKVASYVLNPGTRQHSLDTLAFTELGHRMIPITALIGPPGKKQITPALAGGSRGGGKTLADVPIEEVAEYSCEDADYTWQLYKKLAKQLVKDKLDDLFADIEIPLLPVLEEMENHGIKIDIKFLEKMSKKVGARLDTISKKIYKLAGVEFNINSPVQLKEVLFEKLKISSLDLKKTKTSISTAASELVKLRDEHPIIKLIEEYRELAKLKSTYLLALPVLVDSVERVHTSFNQTVTATGRLSSSNPNLQNIPIRTELGREIRKAFVSKKGFKILAADYSQIELRVIASLANDKKMLESFKAQEDIHTRTAAEINDVSLEKVTPEMRRAAKAINFGIIYGMGVRSLAQSTGVSQTEAREFMIKYFEMHDRIQEYLEETIEEARERGYVETLFGRRRYLPDIHSGVMQVKNAAERMAINQPVQGTAADLMKMAMIQIDKKLPGVSKTAKMLLQVHDELVFEVENDEVKKVAKFVREEMENIYKLKCPIEVKVEVGKNWGNLSQI